MMNRSYNVISNTSISGSTDTEKIMVSIQCAVYNHEPYLRRCLDGFIMQKTSFRYEVIVHDDASTDNSASIIREYAQQYPDIIKPIFESENQYSKNSGAVTRIISQACHGIYIACCEGDDYWTDPLKLQKQVDFMEAHSDYSFCFHGAICHWYDGSEPDKEFSHLETREYSGYEFLQNHIAPTASFLFKRTAIPGYIKMMAEHPRLIVGDTPLIVYCSTQGRVFCFAENMCVYGRNKGSWMGTFDAEKNYALGNFWKEMGLIFRQYKAIADQHSFLAFFRTVKHALHSKQSVLAIKSFFKSFVLHPLLSIKTLAKIPSERRARMNK